MRISYVVPAFNEAVMIGATLRALDAAARASGESFELIVVDDASTDGTPDIARAFGAQVLRVDLHRISAVRNAGARAARGELLAFVDADTLVPAETIAGMLEAVRRGAVGGGARVRLDTQGTPAWTRALADLSCELVYRAGFAGGCFIFARRDAFEAVGGFDERYFASEEIHLCRALKGRGRFAMVSHPVLSSGRKLRLFPGTRLLREMLRVGLGGLPALRRREGLEIWYDGRREAADLRQCALPESPMPEIACRRMTHALRADALALLGAFLEADPHYRASSGAYGDGGEEALGRALDLFLARPEIGFVWLGYEGSEAVAVCVVCFAVSTSAGALVAKLDDVAVRPGREGRGIGSRHLEALVGELRGLGVRRIDTAVHVANAGARRFYERHGFRPLGEERVARLI